MPLSVIEGDGCSCHVLRHRSIARVIREALKTGYTIGSKVMVGLVPGVVIGYNIGFGKYDAKDFPLVVDTPLGVTKSELSEVKLA